MQETDQRSQTEIAINAAYGRTLKFKVPSGYDVTIREQNGNDDDILSNTVTAKDMTNFHIFISSLIIETNLPVASGEKISLEAAKKILIRDKYYIILMSRIHSIGNELNISYDWGEKDGGIIRYKENLERYIWDYSKPFPEEGEPGYDKEKIKPYIIDNPYEVQEIVLESGKKLRFNLYNGNSEITILKLPEDQVTRNTEMKARNLEEFIEGKWVRIENFSSFRPKEMMELKTMVKIADPAFRAITDLSNPITKETLEFPIFGSMNFFYPEEI